MHVSFVLVALLAGCAGTAPTEEAGSSEARISAPSDPAYASSLRHSELTPEIVASLRAILAGGSGDAHAFVKIGDSITASTSFVTCLAQTPIDGEQAALEPTRTFFDQGSWDRRSVAAVVGWHTTQPLAGAPSPLAQEVSAMNPSFALVMLGTNDNYAGSGRTYATNLGKVVDALVTRHVIPILSTIPPSGKPSVDASVAEMNDVVRTIASQRKVPLMNFHDALTGLPAKGIGADTIHPNVGPNGACDFGTSGLTHGYNVRTLLALEALDRVRRAVLADDTTEPADPADPADPANATDPGPDAKTG